MSKRTVEDDVTRSSTQFVLDVTTEGPGAVCSFLETRNSIRAKIRNKKLLVFIYIVDLVRMRTFLARLVRSSPSEVDLVRQ